MVPSAAGPGTAGAAAAGGAGGVDPARVPGHWGRAGGMVGGGSGLATAAVSGLRARPANGF